MRLLLPSFLLSCRVLPVHTRNSTLHSPRPRSDENVTEQFALECLAGTAFGVSEMNVM